ncbi:MAG: pilus assembly protein [Acidobacteriota bacterium]
MTKWKEESGAELLEAAVVLPVLLMLLLGIVAFGRAWNVYQTITRAAREGAREAVLTPCAIAPGCPGNNTFYTAGDIRTDFVEPALQADGLDPTQIKNYTTTYVFMDATNPSPSVCGVQIAFQYPFSFAIPLTTLQYSTITLSTKVQMRLENPVPASQCLAGSAVP